MKINLYDGPKIKKALADVNGRRTAHTFTNHSELLNIAESAENKLERFGICKSHRTGAYVIIQSDHQLPDRFEVKARMVDTTTVVLTRGSTDWFLTGCKATSKYATFAPRMTIHVATNVVEWAERQRRSTWCIEAV